MLAAYPQVSADLGVGDRSIPNESRFRCDFSSRPAGGDLESHLESLCHVSAKGEDVAEWVLRHRRSTPYNNMTDPGLAPCLALPTSSLHVRSSSHDQCTFYLACWITKGTGTE